MPTDPIAPLEVVATNDDARRVHDVLDMTREAIAKYRKSRDPSELRFREGQRAVVFVVQRLPPSHALSLSRLDVVAAYKAAFLAACHLVRLPDGSDLRPDAKTMETVRAGVQAPDETWVDAIADRYGADTVVEIGRVAYEFARMPADPAVRGPFSW